MIRECNANELLTVQQNISFLRFIKNNLNEIKNIFKDKKPVIHEYMEDLDCHIMDFEVKDKPKDLIDIFLKCNINSYEPYYENDFYFENLVRKYNVYNELHPHLTNEMSIGYNYKEYVDIMEDGYIIYESVLYSSKLDKFFDIYFDNESKMQIINETMSKLRNIFCAHYGNCYEGKCFSVIRVSDYLGIDIVAEDYQYKARYLICFLTLSDPYYTSSFSEIIHYAQDLKEMFDYIDKEIANYEANNN